jgi:hypothetical protein
LVLQLLESYEYYVAAKLTEAAELLALRRRRHISSPDT